MCTHGRHGHTGHSPYYLSGSTCGTPSGYGGVLYIMDLVGDHDLKNTGFLFIWPSDLVMLTPPSSEGVVRRPGYRWKAVDLLCTLKGLVFCCFYLGKKLW